MDAPKVLDDAALFPDSDLSEGVNHSQFKVWLGKAGRRSRGVKVAEGVSPAKFRIIVYHGMFPSMWREQTWQRF
jgi:hypothetical protein